MRCLALINVLHRQKGAHGVTEGNALLILVDNDEGANDVLCTQDTLPQRLQDRAHTMTAVAWDEEGRVLTVEAQDRCMRLWQCAISPNGCQDVTNQ